MKKSLVSLAAAAALLAPAMVALTAPAGAALAAPRVHLAQVQKTPNLKLVRRCKLKHVLPQAEAFKLSQAGYKHIKYLGRKFVLRRCAQFYYFTACKGLKKYKLTVRYINLQRFVIVQPIGFCPLVIKPLLKKN